MLIKVKDIKPLNRFDGNMTMLVITEKGEQWRYNKSLTMPQARYVFKNVKKEGKINHEFWIKIGGSNE